MLIFIKKTNVINLSKYNILQTICLAMFTVAILFANSDKHKDDLIHQNKHKDSFFSILLRPQKWVGMSFNFNYYWSK